MNKNAIRKKKEGNDLKKPIKSEIVRENRNQNKSFRTKHCGIRNVCTIQTVYTDKAVFYITTKSTKKKKKKPFATNSRR